jgi:hypothetical protein
MNKFSTQCKRFFEVSFAEKKLFAEAVLFLFFAKIILLLFPFKFCSRFIKSKNCSDKTVDYTELKSLKSAIDRANHLAFWKNICLVQSMASRWMLNRRHISSKLTLGVLNDKNGKLVAHAWVKVKRFEITDKGLDYNELITFE